MTAMIIGTTTGAGITATAPTAIMMATAAKA
jgi:hypothetical protein